MSVLYKTPLIVTLKVKFVIRYNVNCILDLIIFGLQEAALGFGPRLRTIQFPDTQYNLK